MSGEPSLRVAKAYRLVKSVSNSSHWILEGCSRVAHLRMSGRQSGLRSMSAMMATICAAVGKDGERCTKAPFRFTK